MGARHAHHARRREPDLTMPAPTPDEVAQARAAFDRAQATGDAYGMADAGQVLAHDELSRMQPMATGPGQLRIYPVRDPARRD